MRWKNVGTCWTFIQHPTSKRFLFIQKEILRCRIPKKIFDIFKNYILYLSKIILSDEVWSLELFIREEFKLLPRAATTDQIVFVSQTKAIRTLLFSPVTCTSRILGSCSVHECIPIIPNSDEIGSWKINSSERLSKVQNKTLDV